MGVLCASSILTGCQRETEQQAPPVENVKLRSSDLRNMDHISTSASVSSSGASADPTTTTQAMNPAIRSQTLERLCDELQVAVNDAITSPGAESLDQIKSLGERLRQAERESLSNKESQSDVESLLEIINENIGEATSSSGQASQVAASTIEAAIKEAKINFRRY